MTIIDIIPKVFITKFEETNMKRRQVLRFAGGWGIGLTAGCSSDDREEYATMQEFSFVNPHSTPVSVESRIERTDTNEVVHTVTRELTVDPDWIILDCVWPDAPLTVMARPEDGEWKSFDTKDKDGCVSVIAEVREQRASFFVHNAECPIDDPSCHTD
ncbi:hypothetical protein [Natrialba asiatica]|uniref:hypothetical protein n=1 Tax=Natrialba asiatica TaxID=64602 RepID=UPI0012696EC8|nr:hypothetical protein [Natrialba asiatica]